jgi:aminocarboxymuconate-semialdehyde decarboxylase
VGPAAGLDRYYLTNLIGNPLQSTTMFADLAFGGVLDELPGLRLLMAHGGGFLPYQIGRLEHGYQVRPEVRERAHSSPTALLGRVHFDSLTFNPTALRFLVDLVGPGRVVVGTDAPFDMADPETAMHLEATGLDAPALEAVAWRTAQALLGIGGGQ